MVIVADLWGGMVGSIYLICAHIHFKTQVPMVHSCLLVNLKLEESDMLAYTPAKVIIVITITIVVLIVIVIVVVVVVEMVKTQVKDYPGPVDDMIVFALSALLNGNQIFVDNTHYYGVRIKVNHRNHVDLCLGDHASPGGGSALVG